MSCKFCLMSYEMLSVDNSILTSVDIYFSKKKMTMLISRLFWHEHKLDKNIKTLYTAKLNSVLINHSMYVHKKSKKFTILNLSNFSRLHSFFQKI